MSHQNLSVPNENERKIKYDWPFNEQINLIIIDI